MSTSWLIDPLLNPWLVRLTLPLGGLFLLAGIGLCVVQYTQTANGRLAGMQTVLWQRYRTWLLIAFFYVGAVLSGPLALALLCAFLCWQGTYEYGMLASLTSWSTLLLAFSGLLTLLSILVFGPVTLMVAPIAAFFAWSLLAILTTERGLSLEKAFSLATLGFWGYLYVGWLPAHLLALLIGKLPGLVVLVGLGVALSDVGAFCLGKLLGGAKLAPRLSPGKTWSGALGNLCGAGSAVWLTKRPSRSALREVHYPTRR